MTPQTLDALVTARAAKQPVVLATTLATGASTLLAAPDYGDAPQIREAARAALSDDLPRLVQTDSGEVFLNPFNPPLRMAILGAVHIAQPLSVMARLAGYAVTVIDPRTAFATAERFPSIALDRGWPDEALIKFALDRRSAVVALTHDPKLDDPGLEIALKSDCFYIAVLGSRKSQAARLERLAQRGHDGAALARIRGPAGLAIGAKSPAEIAVSILAEATQARRLPQGMPA